tara:strand:+ start:1203 stop:1403 length:201 start_codon:yes stop_codon:yes gene_type:complete
MDEKFMTDCEMLYAYNDNPYEDLADHFHNEANNELLFIDFVYIDTTTKKLVVPDEWVEAKPEDEEQ